MGGSDDCLKPRLHIQLLDDPGHMIADGYRADAESSGNILGRLSGCQQVQDFTLTMGQLERHFPSTSVVAVRLRRWMSRSDHGRMIVGRGLAGILANVVEQMEHMHIATGGVCGDNAHAQPANTTCSGSNFNLHVRSQASLDHIGDRVAALGVATRAAAPQIPSTEPPLPADFLLAVPSGSSAAAFPATMDWRKSTAKAPSAVLQHLLPGPVMSLPASDS